MVSTRAIEILDGIQLGREVGKNVQKSIQEGKHDEGLSLLACQLAGLDQTKKKADKMVDEAKKFEDKNCLPEILSRLDYLEEKVEELISWKRHAQISETVSDFENNLAAYIYPPHTSITFGPIYPNLMLWLDQNKKKPKGEEANNKWIELQVETGIQWTEAHETVLFKMHKCKMVITHQETDASFNNYEFSFSDDDMRLRDEILLMNEFIKSN